MFFILGGHLDAPVHLYDPRVQNPPYVPHTPLCICVFLEASACWGHLTCWTPPLHARHLPHMGDASPCLTSQTHWLASLCICMFRGYLHVIWGVVPLHWGFGGHYMSVKLWCLAIHPLGVHCALPCTFFVVH